MTITEVGVTFYAMVPLDLADVGDCDLRPCFKSRRIVPLDLADVGDCDIAVISILLICVTVPLDLADVGDCDPKTNIDDNKYRWTSPM